MSEGVALSTVDATSPARLDASASASVPVCAPDSEGRLEPGTRAGDFLLEGVLGHGSFGSVYRASHHVIGRRAAVKVLRRSAAEARAITSFIEEARLVSRLRHPNIVDVLTFGQLEDGRHFQVMDLIEGPTLADFLHERGVLTLEEALPIVRGVASALDAVHRSGVTHRDLKPANVVLEQRDGLPFPKLIDFGVAELIAPEAEQPTVSGGALIGTPRYMAPEQCRGRKVDARADSYAFGLLLYEMLTGGPPFAGDDSLAVMLKHTSETPVPPSRVREGLPTAVDPVILSLLEKRPEDRPLELAGVVRELERIAAGPEPGSSPRQWRTLGVVGVVGVGAVAVAAGLLLSNRVPSGAAEQSLAAASNPESPVASAEPRRVDPPVTDPQPIASGAPLASAPSSQASTAPTSRPVPRGTSSAPASGPGPEDSENPFGKH